jgi:GT2 family glycosyltransferase
MEKKISVLLTVHNRKEKTLLCLERLFQQELLQGFIVKIYLTDDGCTDGTREAVEEQFPLVTIVEGDGTLFWNRGMYHAWTFAAKECDYDYYLWINDDTFLYGNCIKRLLAESASYEDKSIVVGSTCSTRDKNIITYGGWLKGKLITELSVPQNCDTINGNIVLIPKYVYSILGTNDPKFRHAIGDTDYGLRAKENHINCVTGIGIFGECDLHEHPTVWMDPTQPFRKRWNNFFSPLGNNPFEYFYFRKKHYGLLPASKTFLTMWIHFFFPRLLRITTVFHHNKQ